MNDCTHSGSLVPIPNDPDHLFICTVCGWKFKVMHVADDPRLEKAFETLRKKGFSNKDISKALEQAIKEWIDKNQNDKETKQFVQFTDDDVELVATQANVSIEKARLTLIDCNGDFAKAILRLTMG